MRLTLGTVCLAAAILAAGCGPSAPGPGSPPPLTGSPEQPAAPGVPVVPGVPPPPGTPPKAARPAAIDVPSIGAKSSLIPLGIQKDGTVQVPDVHHPQQGGWIQVAPSGVATLDDPVVVLAHIDGDHQQGLFYHLKNVKKGDSIALTMTDGTVRNYTVTKTQEISKAQFPSAAVYGQTKDPEIRLVSCGGPFQASIRSYEDSEIVYGKLMD
jgi:LPXTG-site transpeptidase (sortase) family protein